MQCTKKKVPSNRKSHLSESIYYEMSQILAQGDNKKTWLRFGKYHGFGLK